jgi:hypothetical protein
VVPWIVDRLRDVRFSRGRGETVRIAAKAIEWTPIARRISEVFDDVYVNGLIEPSFESELTPAPPGLMTGVSLEVPESVRQLEDIPSLLAEIGKFCRAVDVHGRLRIHVELLGCLLETTSVKDMDIFPYFLGMWLTHVLKKEATDDDIDVLRKHGCFLTLLQQGFLGEADDHLMMFCASLFVDLSHACMQVGGDYHGCIGVYDSPGPSIVAVAGACGLCEDLWTCGEVCVHPSGKRFGIH